MLIGLQYHIDIQCILLAAVLNRELLPGFLHTYAEARMCNMQCALGQGHMTQHDDLLRMDFSNATCLMDCVKTNLVKVCVMASVQYVD